MATRFTMEVALPLEYFLNDGAPHPKIVGMPIMFRKMTF